MFVPLFIGAGFAFGLLSLITGPIAVEAAPLGLVSTAAGIIIGAGEIFGGGVAPAIAGGIACATASRTRSIWPCSGSCWA